MVASDLHLNITYNAIYISARQSAPVLKWMFFFGGDVDQTFKIWKMKKNMTSIWSHNRTEFIRTSRRTWSAGCFLSWRMNQCSEPWGRSRWTSRMFLLPMSPRYNCLGLCNLPHCTRV